MFATPCYGGQLYNTYLASMLQTVRLLDSGGYHWELELPGGESLITRARNRLVARFLASTCTHLVFIDSDIGWDPTSVLKLLHSGKDIIAGAYPKKEINWEAAKLALDSGKDPALYASPVVVHMGGEAIGAVHHGLCEVKEVGTGFMCITRRVFEAMIAANPSCVYTDDSGTNQKIPALFEAGIYRDDIGGTEQPRYLSEDYAFCRVARDLGFPIYVHMDIDLTHTGTHKFLGTPHQHHDGPKEGFRCPSDHIPTAMAILGGSLDPGPIEPAPKSIYIDHAGAGAVAVWASRRWPGIEVLAYEPDPTLHALLLHNMKGYGVHGATCNEHITHTDFDLICTPETGIQRSVRHP